MLPGSATRRAGRGAAAVALLMVIAACQPSGPAPTAGPTATPPPTGQPTPAVTATPAGTKSGTGHYDIVVANLNGGTHKGPGEHVGDGLVECAETNGTWVYHGVYFPTDAVDPGKDVSDFSINTAPGHQWIAMTLMAHTTDSTTDWSVLEGFDGATFTFTVNDTQRPVSISGVAKDHSQTISISAICSAFDNEP
jgi:hypothetical protein